MPNESPACRFTARGSPTTWSPTSLQRSPRDLQVDLGDGPRDAAAPPTSRSWSAPTVAARPSATRSSAAGVPAVLQGAGSVFASPMAEDWLTLLVALEQPWQYAVRQAALTCFVGWTFAELAAADEARLTELTQRVRWWSRVLAGRGVAALLETATTDTGLRERLLATSRRRAPAHRPATPRPESARRHGPGQLGVSALVEWLRARIGEAARRHCTEGTRRLDTDARSGQRADRAPRARDWSSPWSTCPTPGTGTCARRRGRSLLLHELPDERRSSRRCVLDVGGGGGPGRRPVASRPGRGGRRGPPAALRRADPRPVSGGHLVGAVPSTPRLRPCSGFCPAHHGGGQLPAPPRTAADGATRAAAVTSVRGAAGAAVGARAPARLAVRPGANSAP